MEEAFRKAAERKKTATVGVVTVASAQHIAYSHQKHQVYLMQFTTPTSKKAVFPHNREVAFEFIAEAIGSNAAYRTDESLLAQGDSLQLVKQLPDSSVDLVLTDPPYHTTKKANIYGDASFIDNDEYLSWIDEYMMEWRRVLRPNGTIYLFCSSEMAPFIYVQGSKMMNMHNIITWTKPNEPGYDGWKQKMKKTALRQWYPHSEKIVVCSPAAVGNLKRSPFGMFLKECRKKCEMSSNLLTEVIGAYGKVNNGGAVSNWETGRNIPSREQYSKICDAFMATGHIEFMPAYEDVIRAFNVNPTLPFTDAWDHMNVRQYRGKHPAEKPRDLLELIISTSSYPGDVVLDCFNGSGSTMLAAKRLQRRAVGIEIEEKWIEYARNSLQAACGSNINYDNGSKSSPTIQNEKAKSEVFAIIP
ncbi:DNA-methyltransferase [Sulfitobacter sp. MF3-043]|uniref:DNA-methyltransferase n=1 Tax=Sulfitobacter sediminivivens TaxID=3252902 RepID=UPI0036DE6B8C